MKATTILLALLLLIACAHKNESEQPLTDTAQSNSGYFLIRDNLYCDVDGNLYLRSVNNEDVEKKHEVWLKTVYCDTCWTPSEEGWTGVTELKDFVDTATFHLDTTDMNSGVDIYADKNHRYRHKWMADGGTISIVEK